MNSRAATGVLAAEAADAFRAFRDGDTGRMADLVRLLSPTLWGVARSCGLDPSQAEEVVQAGWVALVSHAESVRDPQAVFGWLLTTVRREAWRVSRRREAVELDDEPASALPGPEAVAESKERSALLWRHVQALNPRCQALLRVVAFATSPDYSAISVALGMPVGSIGPTRGRCLAALRTALQRDPGWSEL